MKLLNICQSCKLILLLIVVADTVAATNTTAIKTTIAAATTTPFVANENSKSTNNNSVTATHRSGTAGYNTTTATTTIPAAESAPATPSTATDTDADAMSITPEVFLSKALKSNNSRSMLKVAEGYSSIKRATTKTITTAKATEAATTANITSNEATAKAISTKTTPRTLAHHRLLNKTAVVSASISVSGPTSGSASIVVTPIKSAFETATITSTSTTPTQTPIKEKIKRRRNSKKFVHRVETRSARKTTTVTTTPITATATTEEENNNSNNHQDDGEYHQQHHVAVLLPSKILKKIPVQQGFNNFVDFFQVNLKNITVDFLHDDGLSGLMKLLEQSKYSVVVRTLNVGSAVEDDSVEGIVLISNRTSNHNSSSGDPLSESLSSEYPNRKKGQQKFAKVGEEALLQDAVSNAAEGCFCHLAEHLSLEYHKRVLLWPCSNMKESSHFLPSFEAISYAVQSIATKLNWTQAEIFVGDQNWGLPLAIAANLHLPYTITVGSDARDLHAQDKIGKAIIITANMNDVSTLRLLRQLETLQHTKVLLIDMVATSFNAENRFYKNLARIERTSQLMSNLLLLTVLSDKYRHFLSVTFDNNDIEKLQNFRQMRRWRGTNFTEKPADAADWPMHLDSSMAQVLPMTTTVSLSDLSDCALLPKPGDIHFEELCGNKDQFISENCTQVSVEKAAALRATLEKLCHLYSPPDQQQTSETSSSQQKIAGLRNFIDFFNFYDFLIASVLHSTPHPSPPQVATRDERRANVPKYDFIVLDVVRGKRAMTTSAAPPTADGDLNLDGSGSGGSDRTYNMNSNNDKDNSNNNNNNNYNKNSNYLSHNKHRSDNENHRATNNNSTQHSHNRNGTSFKWRPLLILEQHEINLNTYITHSILPGYDEWLLVRTAQLTQCGAICWTLIAICVGVLFIIVAASVAAGIAMRNYYLRKRLSKGPNKIVLSASDFVFPVDSRRVDEGIEAMLCCWLQQLQEFGGPEVDRPDLLKGSIGSLKNLGLLIPGSTIPATANGKNLSGSSSLARHNPALLDMRARYNGDLVQIKEVQLNGSMELKSKAMDLLVMAHGLRHENINPLIGWLSDPQRTAMVFDYCSRGSLQDVLIMDEIKLDWSFRLSLLTDLVRGMRYLHASPVRVHGALSSRNCVVDARWVLKITDYGLASFSEAQGLPQLPRSTKELLWTAPELLRSMKLHHQQHHGGQVTGTQMGDVYSFGIIMQEVVVRGEPYCMLSLSAEEIIAKIKKPPPLIRPSVSKGAAPPEAINIMRQCWAEQPEMRPDFNSVYERFKMLNHGRKVNFVDTMFQMLEKYSNNLEELIRDRTEQLDIERKKTEQLLNRMLPSSVAEKLKMGLAVDPEEFSDVTIYFSDIVGFTTIAAHCSPVQVVDLLNDLYTIFDATINAYNVYKVETIGDAYMVVSGLPVKIPDHAEQIATMALDLLHQSGRFNVKHLPGVPLQLRIGLHTGPCCAGVVGLTMPRYCLFGDTVNTASRMESTGSSWRIHMSQETRDRLEARGGYTIEPRGLIDIKGKGMMNTFWLLGKKGFDKPLPVPPPIGESHGLDESFIRNSIILKAQANKSRTSTNPSSSQSSSLAGESVEVKVEITPPTNTDVNSSILPNSYSLDSNSTNTISPNMTLCPDFPTKTPNASPQSRKFSELTPDSLLNPNSFNRLPNSTGGSSSRLYKKIEEIMDLSSPYNHYKCLSPSESNLTQFCGDSKYLYSGLGSGEGSTSSAVVGYGGGGILHSGSAKFDSKPGSSRLLRRQFSLDRDDSHTRSDAHHQQIHQSSLQASHTLALSNKSNMLDIPVLHDTARSPKGRSMVHKQNSNSIAQDLEKIEEIPLSPSSSQQHSSLDSNLNRSPPSTVDARSADTLVGSNGKPESTRSFNGSRATSPAPISTPPTEKMSIDTGLDNVTVSTAASIDLINNSTNDTISTEERNNIKKSELTLNVETLMTR